MIPRVLPVRLPAFPCNMSLLALSVPLADTRTRVASQNAMIALLLQACDAILALRMLCLATLHPICPPPEHSARLFALSREALGKRLLIAQCSANRLQTSNNWLCGECISDSVEFGGVCSGY